MASLAPVARRSDSALRTAIVASLALHALVLIGAPALQESFVAPVVPPLQGRLADAVAVPMPVEPTAPVKAKPRPRVQPAQAIEPAPVPAIVEATGETAAQGGTPSPSLPTVAAASPSASLAAGTAPQPADPRSVGEYRVLLIGAAGRYKRYPAPARENSWTGQVVVGVSVGSDGTPSFSVKKGSGHEVLDRQALDMFGQAARDVPVPAALRGQAFAFSVRAIYGLED